MTRTKLLGGITVVAILTAAGIGAVLAQSPETPAQPDTKFPASRATASSAVPEGSSATASPARSIPPYAIPADQLPAWMDAVSDPVRSAIEDGVFTFQEYEAAVFLTLSCIEDAGMTVVHSRGYGRSEGIESGPRLSKRGVYSYHVTVTTYSPTPPAREIKLLEGCKTLSAGAQQLWAQHTVPTAQEHLAMRNHMAACLRAAGAAVFEDPSDRDLRALRDEGLVSLDDYRACQFEAADAFSIDGPPG